MSYGFVALACANAWTAWFFRSIPIYATALKLATAFSVSCAAVSFLDISWAQEHSGVLLIANLGIVVAGMYLAISRIKRSSRGDNPRMSKTD